MTIKIGLSIDPAMPRFLELAREAERIGVDSVWVAEYWAYDAFTPLAAIAAVTDRLRLATGIAQLGARTPAMLAMTAQGVQAVSDGRLILGIGASGPQVIEGWHGVPFDRPGAAHPRDDRDHQDDHRRRAPVLRRLGVPAAAAGRGGPGDPVTGRDGADPGVRRLARAGQPAPHRGARRRLDRQLVLPGNGRRLLRPDRRGRASTPAGRSTTSIVSSPSASTSPTTTRTRSPPPGAATPTGTPSRSAPWARRRRTSTTTRSPARATATTSPRSNVSGRRATVTPRRHACRSRSASAPTSSDRPTTIRDRLAEYERSGVTTLRVGVNGAFDEKIADLETARRPRRRGRRVARHDRLTAPDPPPTARRSTTIDTPAATTTTTTGSPTISAPRSPHEPGSTPSGSWR